MDSQQLASLLDFIYENQKNVHSVLVLRNGHLVLEAYFDPYSRDTKHPIASATKSITSMLVGIALEQGVIKSVDQQVLALLLEAQAVEVDPRTQEIKIEHLLTMTSGLHWQESNRSYWSETSSFVEMTQQESLVEYILGQPMKAAPGEKFNYNSGASHLLSAIIQQESGMSTAAYAEENLFHPLDIDDTYWESDPDGITTGGWGLLMRPLDMAKLGYLALQNGTWEGRTIIPAEWIAESTAPRVDTISSSDLRVRVMRFIYRLRKEEVPALGYSFGYHCWIPTFGGYAARGNAGQAIFVLPEQELVVVFTGGLPRQDQFLPEKLMERIILPSIVSDGPLPPNPQAVDALWVDLQASAQPELEAASTQPPTAVTYSGKKYLLRENALELQSIALTLVEGSEAGLEVRIDDEVHNWVVGLDGISRINPVGELESLALKGRWIDDNTFVMDWQMVASARKYELSLHFRGDRVQIRARAVLEGWSARIAGQVEE
ncbi:MAG: serine hydrolase domain-containing protein [Planctomycetota bacterium]|jgi:CubicO group peptidase (beta-lactamase class C family)